jgi:probable HAF family extracellular repeat protein
VAAQPPPVDIATLGVGSAAVAINAHGQIAGENALAPSPQRHAFSWTAADGMIDLGTLGHFTSSYAVALNGRGRIVGNSYTNWGSQESRAFSWTASEGMVDLGTLGGTRSEARAVNDRGAVVGESSLDQQHFHAFLWTASGGMTDLGHLGNNYSTAAAVNANQQVVGFSETSQPEGHAFSWTAAGGMIDLEPLPGDIASAAYAVNDQGVVAGISISLAGNRAVYWKTSATELRISTPNEPGRWGVGTLQRLAWTYSGDAPQFQIDISRDAGRTWDYITTAANAPGSSQNFYWRVTGPLTMAARFRVNAITDPGASDINDANIRIADATIEILTPTASTVALVGSTLKIGIKHTLGAGAPVVIEASADNGRSWRTAAQRRTTGSSTSSFLWAIDLPPTTRASVRVRSLDGSLAKATSGAFTVSVTATTDAAR